MKKLLMFILFCSCSSISYYEYTFGNSPISMINIFSKGNNNTPYSLNVSYNLNSNKYKFTIFYYSSKENIEIKSLKIKNINLKYSYNFSFEYIPILKNFYYKHSLSFEALENDFFIREIRTNSLVNLYLVIQGQQIKISVDNKLLEALNQRAKNNLKKSIFD